MPPTAAPPLRLSSGAALLPDVPSATRLQVTVPIKVRAIIKGFLTGYNDRYHFHDNSWWVSFGASPTLMWIRLWLMLLVTIMTATILGVIIQFAKAGAEGEDRVITLAMPLLYSGLAALNYLWLLFEPVRYLINGKGAMAIAPRWLEVGITLAMISGIYGFLALQQQQIQ